MKKLNCPYLGLQEDPTTALGFPSPGNYCHHAQPTASVNTSHQSQYCLTENHVSCPVYRMARPMPLPAELAAQPARSSLDRRMAVILLIPLLITAVFLFSNAGNLWNSGVGSLIPETGATSQPAENGSFDFNLLVPTSNLTMFASPSPTPVPELDNCPLPDGWTTYVVNPTDSIFRLSIMAGVSIDQFQRANCMGNETVILPGQVVYIPALPTNTPSAVQSPTLPRLFPTNTNPPASDEADEPPPEEEEPKPPTPVPPTRVPPTRVPPTSVPPTPVPPTATFVPPSATPIPPTSTPVQPTDPPISPTDTLVVPTNPPVSPTDTPVPPEPEPDPTGEPEPPPATEVPPPEPTPPDDCWPGIPGFPCFPRPISPP